MSSTLKGIQLNKRLLNFWLTFAFIEGICRKQSGNPMVSRGGVRKSGTPEHPGPWSLHLRSPKLSPPSGPCCRLWQRPPLLLVSIVFAFQNSSCPKETVMMELMRRNIVRQIFRVVFLFSFVHQLFFLFVHHAWPHHVAPENGWQFPSKV